MSPKQKDDPARKVGAIIDALGESLLEATDEEIRQDLEAIGADPLKVDEQMRQAVSDTPRTDAIDQRDLDGEFTDGESICAAYRTALISAEREVAELRDLSNFINAADISAADAPHTVVEKLQRAMLKGKP